MSSPRPRSRGWQNSGTAAVGNTTNGFHAGKSAATSAHRDVLENAKPGTFPQGSWHVTIIMSLSIV